MYASVRHDLEPCVLPPGDGGVVELSREGGARAPAVGGHLRLVPEPKVGRPFGALDHVTPRVEGGLVEIAVWEHRVEDEHRQPLRLDAHAFGAVEEVARLGALVGAWEARLAALARLVEVEELRLG